MKNKFLRGLIGTSIFIAVFGAASTAVMFVELARPADHRLDGRYLLAGGGPGAAEQTVVRRDGKALFRHERPPPVRGLLSPHGKSAPRCGTGSGRWAKRNAGSTSADRCSAAARINRKKPTMTAVKKKRRLVSQSDLPLVYDQYKPELEGYIRRRVDSAEDTEDILQDVFYKLTKTDLQENPIEYLSAWLYQAVTNRIIDRRRKKREQALPETRQENEDDYFLDSLSDFLADDGNDPEIMFRNELIREEIELALSESSTRATFGIRTHRIRRDSLQRDRRNDRGSRSHAVVAETLRDRPPPQKATTVLPGNRPPIADRRNEPIRQNDGIAFRCAPPSALK